MYKYFLILIASFLTILSCSKSIATSKTPVLAPQPLSLAQLEEVKTFQKELNEFYSNPEESPLGSDKVEGFGGHEFFETNPVFRIEADFKKKSRAKYVGFETSTDRIAKYDFYGVAKFKINNKTYALNVYQSHRAREMEEYKDHLFLPFTDLTSGVESYGGGRYVDLKIPSGNKILIDFNKAYNPYCAYSDKYSCPVPPKENQLDLEVRAGVKYDGKYH